MGHLGVHEKMDQIEMQELRKLRTLCQFALHSHIGILIGTAFFITSLFLYRSYENRPVFDLWSYPFFSVIITANVLFVVLLFLSWRSFKRFKKSNKASRSLSLLYLEIAICLLGLAYFINTFDDPRNGARILKLVVFASSNPASMILEWLSLILIFFIACTFISRSRHSKYSNILLVLISFFALTVLLEGAFRLKAIVSPTIQGFPTYTTSCWGRRYVKLNSKGFRDVKHSIRKPEGTRRILIVGDSFAFGSGINSIEKRFGELLATLLSAKTQYKWETINTSRGDTHTLQHIEFLKKGLSYHPDIVILLYVFNDIDYLHPVTLRSTYNHLHSVISLTGLLYRNSYLFQGEHYRFVNGFLMG